MTSTPSAHTIGAQDSRQAGGPPDWLRRLAFGLSVLAAILIVAARGKLGTQA
ncbi:hypothetical protein [Kibdelosporangium aridum]|uniref:hypothetical protein n=1 Tax=Kibdelosporangium aridum TaxID=2030 RepID=UPI00163CFB59|nr:hypothetical protein [Kibdelosporangium aridum]